IPLDVVFEVFMHLDPIDLLSLSRVSKLLRNILMSKTSSSIWCATRSNVPSLPPIPEHFSEPQYAHFIFSEYCNVSVL
ncbi:hypothetical protein BT96DRAFT_836984, partial [Gymnopus androsaceus JB14]